MVDKLKTSVEKLLSDGSNWVNYRDWMIWSLRSWGLLLHLALTTMPANYTVVGSTQNVTPAMQWEADKATTMQVIAASIPNSVFTNIKSKTTAKDAWDTLKALFEGRMTMVLVQLSQQLQSACCGDDNNVCEHFEKLANLWEQLAAMGKSMPSNEYASISMGSLPTTYAGMLGSIAVSAEMSRMAVSSTVVIKLAIDEYDWHTLQSGKAQDEAFTADDQKKKKGKRNNIKCENCHQRGHTKDQCWVKGGSNEGGGPKHRGKDDDKKDKDKTDSGDKAAAASTKEKEPDIEAWAAIEDIESDDAALYVPAAVVEYSAKAECEIYDSGALRHMSPHCKHFVTYETIPARLITAANNKVFHAIGMGDLEVQLSNGKKWLKVLLKDILHTPDMTLTVVSIGRIMKVGYNIEFDEDEQVCWIHKKKNGPIIGCIPVGANNLFKVEHALSASTQLLAQPMDISHSTEG
jgi:LTR polyprotein gag-polypeptide-like protein/Pol polyprotein